MNDWRTKHSVVISDFLNCLNNVSHNFILKGDTALLTCYNLDRFSEDIDLDGKDENIIDIVEKFCAANDYTYRIGKNTDTVKRLFINYGNAGTPLKVETSYRRTQIFPEECAVINGILTYNIDTLCIMKTSAYSSRDKIRDLYDIAFICNNFYDELSSQTISLLRSAIEHKGIEQFDYLLKTQKDELVDTNKLAENFLKMHDKLGLLYQTPQKTFSEVKAAAIEKAAIRNNEKTAPQITAKEKERD